MGNATRHPLVVYIAGPYRAPNTFEIRDNVHRAHRLNREVWKLGAIGLCPHKNTEDFDYSLPDDVFLDGDLELLRRCDALITTPDWQASRGARGEVNYARDHSIPVFHRLKDLAEWLRTGGYQRV